MEIAFTRLSRGNCGTKSNQLIRRWGGKKNIAIEGMRSMTGREFSCFSEELPRSISPSPLFEGLFFTARIETTIKFGSSIYFFFLTGFRLARFYSRLIFRQFFPFVEPVNRVSKRKRNASKIEETPFCPVYSAFPPLKGSINHLMETVVLNGYQYL